MPNLKTRVFAVTVGLMGTDQTAHRIEAAYYKTEDGFTTFKDVDNQAVFTVRDHHLVTVERDHGAEPVVAAFRQALQQASETGSATVGFRNSSVDATGNETPETGYDITVVLIGEAGPAA